MFDKHHKKESPTFTGITRGVGGFGFGVASGAEDVIEDKTWVSTMGGSADGYGTSDINLRDLDVDSDGNIYVIGDFTSNSFPNGRDIFIIKYRKDGSVVWQRYLTASSTTADHEDGMNIRVGSSGDIYFSGSTFYRFSLLGASNSTIVGKYNSSGDLQWMRIFGVYNNSVECFTMELDSSDNIYLGGMFVQGYPFVSNGWIAKYNSSGTRQWVRKYDPYSLGGTVYVRNVAVDSDGGNYYFCGSYQNTSGSYYTAIAKYDSSHNTQWEKQVYTAASAGLGATVETDSSGNVFLLTNSQSSRFVICKFNSSGTTLWQKEFSHNQSAVYGYNMKIDSSGDVFITGAGRLSMSDSSNDMMILKIGGASGNLISKVGLGEAHGNSVSGGPDPRNDYGYAIRMNNDFVYVCGTTNSIDHYGASSFTRGLVFKVPNDNGATLYGTYDISANDGVSVQNYITYGGLGTVGGVDHMATSQLDSNHVLNTYSASPGTQYYNYGDYSSTIMDYNVSSDYTSSSIDLVPTLYLIDGVTGYSAGPHPGF